MILSYFFIYQRIWIRRLEKEYEGGREKNSSNMKTYKGMFSLMCNLLYFYLPCKTVDLGKAK